MRVTKVACCKLGALSFNAIINAMRKMSQAVFSPERKLTLDQVVERLLQQLLLEHFQGWDSHSFSGQRASQGLTILTGTQYLI